jgi:hypothetical protein
MAYFSAGGAAAACSVPLAGALLSWYVLLVAECCACCCCCCSCSCCRCSSSACCSSSFHSRVSGSRMSPYRAASSAAHPVAMKGALHPAQLLRSCFKSAAMEVPSTADVQSAGSVVRRLESQQILLCHYPDILLKMRLTSGRTCLQGHHQAPAP